MISFTACTDTLIDDGGDTGNTGINKGIGEIVQFTAGTTSNTLASRAESRAEGGNHTETPGETYYMGDASRFVCRMYYKAADSDDAQFDLTEGTKTVSWLVVDGKVGNSLYWNRNYQNVALSSQNADKSDRETYDDYGNDLSANMFYWQNRREHAFLAWTDLNRSKDDGFKYAATKGMLKMENDVTYTFHTGRKELHYVLSGYKLVGDNAVLKPTFKDMVDYAVADYAHVVANEAQTTVINSMPEFDDYASTYSTGWNSIRYYYKRGEVIRHDEVKDSQDHTIKYNWGPYVYYVWGEHQRVEYTFEDGDEVDSEPDAEGNYWVKNSSNVIVAQRGDAYPAPDDYEPKGAPYDYTDSEENVLVYHFWAYRYGQYQYDISQKPAYAIALYRAYEEKESEIVDELPANEFDLTRGTKTSINQQPDIVQALTIMKPEGATQAANRVNLYFKRQFSQVQVNIKNAADNSVELSRGDIEKVELLGVTEKGYVFTEIDETGEIRKAAYADIDFSKFTEMQLKDNPFGTSFDMFELPEEQTATGYLKSFNAITYGHLQAIRITWNEQNTDAEGHVTKGKTHAAVFRIPDTELVNLKSGVRYIWNIEVRRGTLAVIRTEIVDWELPKDADHNQTIDGTIQN